MFRNTTTKTIAVVAATVGLAGAGTAVGASLVTGKDIQNGSVTGIDIKNKSLGVKDLKASARQALRGPAGPAGPAGAAGTPGAKGDTGAQGERGPSDVFYSDITTVNAPNALETVDTLDLAAGKYQITAVITGTSLAGGGHSLRCQLANGDTVLDDARDYYVDNTGRGNITLLAVADLSGVAADSNDVALKCTDEDSGVLIDPTMTAVKVAAITAA